MGRDFKEGQGRGRYRKSWGETEKEVLEGEERRR